MGLGSVKALLFTSVGHSPLPQPAALLFLTDGLSATLRAVCILPQSPVGIKALPRRHCPWQGGQSACQGSVQVPTSAQATRAAHRSPSAQLHSASPVRFHGPQGPLCAGSRHAALQVCSTRSPVRQMCLTTASSAAQEHYFPPNKASTAVAMLCPVHPEQTVAAYLQCDPAALHGAGDADGTAAGCAFLLCTQTPAAGCDAAHSHAGCRTAQWHCGYSVR